MRLEHSFNSFKKMLSLWMDEASPIYPTARVANRLRLRMDCRNITSKPSSSNCCFLNLKYSSIRHLIRNTFATMWHKRFLSCILRLLNSSIGSAPKPYTAARQLFCGKFIQFYGNAAHFTVYRFAAFFLEIHAIVSFIFSLHIHDVTGLSIINNIPVLFGVDHKTLTAFQEIMVIR